MQALPLPDFPTADAALALVRKHGDRFYVNAFGLREWQDRLRQRARTVKTSNLLHPPIARNILATIATFRSIQLTAALAAPGDLDTSFANGGEVVDTFGGDAGQSAGFLRPGQTSFFYRSLGFAPTWGAGGKRVCPSI